MSGPRHLINLGANPKNPVDRPLGDQYSLTNMFKKPDAGPPPTPPVPVPPPSINDAAAAAESYSDQLRQRRGRASTVLSGSQGSDVSNNNLASKLLLGN